MATLGNDSQEDLWENAVTTILGERSFNEMRRVGSLIFGLLMFALNSVVSADCVIPDTITPSIVIGGRAGRDKFEKPQAIKIDSKGKLLVVDADPSQILVFDLAGNIERRVGSIGSGENEFSEPVDLAISGGSIYVADYGNRRISLLNDDYVVQGHILPGIDLSFVEAGRMGEIFVGTTFGSLPGEFLVMKFSTQTKKFIETQGKLIGDSSDSHFALASLNRVTIAKQNDTSFFWAHMSLATIFSGRDFNNPTMNWSIACEVDKSRQWFYENLPDYFGNMRAEERGHTTADYVRDIRLVSKEKKRWIELISDIEVFEGVVYVVASSSIQLYSKNGKLLRTIVLYNELGEKLYFQRIALQNTSTIWALDAIHRLEAYKILLK